VGVFVGLLVLSTGAFVATERAHLARLNADSATGEVAGVELTGSGTNLSVSVTLQVGNPTGHGLDVWSIVLDVRLDGTRITARSPRFDSRTIPARATETFTVRLSVTPEHRELVRREFDPEAVEVDGYLWVRIVDDESAIAVGSPDPRAAETPTPRSERLAAPSGPVADGGGR
jgi:hypothetical protein